MRETARTGFLIRGTKEKSEDDVFQGLSFTPFDGQIVKENCDHWPRIGLVTENPRSNAV